MKMKQQTMTFVFEWMQWQPGQNYMVNSRK